MADTNQPIVYSRSGKTKELVAGARKTISFDVSLQVAWWCKVTHQPGGVRRTPRTPPGSATGVKLQREWTYLTLGKNTCAIDLIRGALSFRPPMRSCSLEHLWDLNVPFRNNKPRSHSSVSVKEQALQFPLYITG